MTGICFLFPNWRTASIICALCALPGVIIIIFILPESPTWLHSKVTFLKFKKKFYRKKLKK